MGVSAKNGICLCRGGHLVVLAFVMLALFIGRAQASEYTILYTSNTNGRLENCRCPSDPLGALEKQLGEIERQREMGPVLLLDGGDFSPATLDSLASRYVLRAYQLYAYDAIAIGDQELYQGREHLMRAAEKLPLVCANLTDTTGAAFAPPWRMVSVGGDSVLVIGTIQPETVKRLPGDIHRQYRVTDVRESVENAIEQAPVADRTLLLSHAEVPFNQQLADELEGIDLIVGGHDNHVSEEPYRGEQTTFLQAGYGARTYGAAVFRGPRVRMELHKVQPHLPDHTGVMELILQFREERLAQRRGAG